MWSSFLTEAQHRHIQIPQIPTATDYMGHQQTAVGPRNLSQSVHTINREISYLTWDLNQGLHHSGPSRAMGITVKPPVQALNYCSTCVKP